MDGEKERRVKGNRNGGEGGVIRTNTSYGSVPVGGGDAPWIHTEYLHLYLRLKRAYYHRAQNLQACSSNIHSSLFAFVIPLSFLSTRSV